MTTMGHRIEQLRQRRGFSQKELGAKVGISQQAVEKIEAGLTRTPRKLVQLAAALGTDSTYLLEGRGDPNVAPTGNHSPIIPYAHPSSVTNRRDLPVLGRAEGGTEGNMVMESDPIDWTHRPADLQDIPSAFAIYVTGESMVPKYRPGDLAYIHPHRPVRQGRFVLVETRDHRGLIKEYIGWKGDILLLRQYNPEIMLKFPRADILRVMLVLGSMDA